MYFKAEKVCKVEKCEVKKKSPRNTYEHLNKEKLAITETFKELSR